MGHQKLQSNQFKTITPSDTENFGYETQTNKGAVLFVGTGGDLRVLSFNGDDVVFKNIPDGSFLPIQAVRVFSTNTTATDIVALW